MFGIGGGELFFIILVVLMLFGSDKIPDIARALVNHPKILFLDEPTTGLDPQTRHNIWNYIEDLRINGSTKHRLYNTSNLTFPQTKKITSLLNLEYNNIEFIEVWMMSPFKEGYGGNGGNLYIELGDVSEDILRDSRLFFEHGLRDSSVSSSRTDTTRWSRIPRAQAVTNAFDNDRS
jgi:hypothetical protein